MIYNRQLAIVECSSVAAWLRTLVSVIIIIIIASADRFLSEQNLLKVSPADIFFLNYQYYVLRFYFRFFIY